MSSRQLHLQLTMGKRIINIFLILVLAIQILPIQQMGKLLYCNQFTEEIPHGMDNSGESIKQTESKSDFISTPEMSLLKIHGFIAVIRPIITDVIPQNYTTEIHVPPPNC